MKRFVSTCMILLFIANADLIAAVKNIPSSLSSIQLALDSCNEGDTVLVAPGIYYENINWPNTHGIKLLSSKGADSTFITGSKDGRILSIGAQSNNLALDTNTIIRGFTISNRLNNVGSRHGGGVLVVGSVKLEYLNIEYNYLFPSSATGGAGIQIGGSNSIINGCNIRFNSLDSSNRTYGAGIHSTQRNLKIINSKIYGNSAISSSWCFGAGIYVIFGGIQIIDSEVSKNITNGESYSHGAGIYLVYGSAQIINSEISNNISSGGGYSHGAGIYAFMADSIVLDRVKIENNQTGGTATSLSGVGAFLWDTHCKFNNVLVANNIMNPKNGSNSSGSSGIGVSYYNSNNLVSEFNHVTISNNINADSLKIDGLGLAVDRGSVVVKNSIIYNPGNGTEVYLDQYRNNSLDINYSNVREGYLGNGNIDVNPKFISDTNFRLLDSSACAGAGATINVITNDLDNNLRPQPSNTPPDMGCYEIDQSATGLSYYKTPKNSINLFPNPVKKGSYFKIKGAGTENLKLVDINGKTIPLQPIFSSNDIIELSSSQLSTGVYFIFSNNHIIEKLVITD